MSDMSPAAPSAGMMRRLRARRKVGFRLAEVELRSEEVERLCLLGYFEGDPTPTTLGRALGQLLDRLPPPAKWPAASGG